MDIFKTPPSVLELRELVKALGVKPREILRTRDAAYEELGLESGTHSDAQLLELMAKHPGLIQRPIVVRGERCAIGRPPQDVERLLRPS